MNIMFPRLLYIEYVCDKFLIVFFWDINVNFDNIVKIYSINAFKYTYIIILYPTKPHKRKRKKLSY